MKTWFFFVIPSITTSNPSLACFFKFNSIAEINLYLPCVVTIKYNNWLLLYVLLMSHKKFSLLSFLHSWLHSHCINEHLKTNQCQFLLICSGFQITVITTRKCICWWNVKIKKWWISENYISIAPFSDVNTGDSKVERTQSEAADMKLSARFLLLLLMWTWWNS